MLHIDSYQLTHFFLNIFYATKWNLGHAYWSKPLIYKAQNIYPPHCSHVCYIYISLRFVTWKNEKISWDPIHVKVIWKASLHGHPFSALWTKCEHIDVSNRGDGCMSWNGTLQKGHDKPRCILCFRSHLWHNQCLDLKLLCLQNECIVRIL
jgi:hypothetical protein